MYNPNQTLNRISLVGLGGGLALIAALYYPLYVLLPSQYLADWQRGVPLLVILLLIALFLVVGTGYLAARQTSGTMGASSRIKGALAGGIAATIFFYGLGGAAAGVVGSRAILLHGLVPAESESHFSWLLAESVTQTISSVYGIFWLTVLAGVGLGAIGGLLAPLALARQRQEPDWIQAAEIAQAALLASLSSLLFAVAVFTVLGSQVENVAAEFQADGFFLSLSPAWVSISIGGTTQVLYLLSITVFYLLIHKAMQSQEPTQVMVARGQAYLGAFVAAFLPLLLFIMLGSPFSEESNQVMYTIIVLGAAISLLPVILLLRSANASAHYLPTAVLPTHPQWAQWLQRSLIPTVILTFILSLLGIQSIAWLLLLIVTTAFAILWRRSLSFDMSLERIQSSLLPAMLAATLPFLVTVPAILAHVLISAPAITPLSAYPDSTSLAAPVDFTLADNVHSLYMAHPTTLLIALVLAAMLVGLNVLIVKLAQVRRRWQSN